MFALVRLQENIY